jgi:hypothetical protein
MLWILLVDVHIDHWLIYLAHYVCLYIRLLYQLVGCPCYARFDGSPNHINQAIRYFFCGSRFCNVQVVSFSCIYYFLYVVCHGGRSRKIQTNFIIIIPIFHGHTQSLPLVKMHVMPFQVSTRMLWKEREQWGMNMRELILWVKREKSDIVL